MPKPNSGHPVQDRTASASDVSQILGDMDDSTAVAILDLQPTIAQLQEAQIWFNGAGEVLGKQRHPLDGVVAQIFDMLATKEEEQPPIKR